MADGALIDAAVRGMALAYWARERPERVAIVSGHGDRTFGDLNARANRLVRALRARGVQTGDGIALMCANRPEFAEVAAAAQRGGLRLTTVNWHLTGPEAGYVVDDCDATAFVADARFAGAAADAAERAPGLRARFAVGGPIAGFDEYDGALAEQPGDDIDDPVLGTSMLYTSGTTGRPKGVHRAVTPPTLRNWGEAWRYDPDRDAHLCTGPLYHAAPLAFSLNAPALSGVPIVLMDGWSAEETLRLVDAHRVTHTHMVPTMFHRLLALPAEVRARYDVSSLRFVLHGAAPCPVPVKQRIMEWWGPIVWEYYAATEGVGSLVAPEEWLAHPGTVGRPMVAGQVEVLDGGGRTCAPGEIGTIYLKAPPTREAGRFEYYKNGDQTEAAFRGDYFTLGDVGYLDGDGYLYLTDRSANVIISGGVNIYPAEIEAVLLTHPAVGDAGMIGVPDEEWGERVLAVVEVHEGLAAGPALAAELVEWCRERLAHYKCPRQVEFTDALPRHDNGKLYKQVLREQYRARSAETGGSA